MTLELIGAVLFLLGGMCFTYLIVLIAEPIINFVTSRKWSNKKKDRHQKGSGKEKQ